MTSMSRSLKLPAYLSRGRRPNMPSRTLSNSSERSSASAGSISEDLCMSGLNTPSMEVTNGTAFPIYGLPPTSAAKEAKPRINGKFYIFIMFYRCYKCSSLPFCLNVFPSSHQSELPLFKWQSCSSWDPPFETILPKNCLFWLHPPFTNLGIPVAIERTGVCPIAVNLVHQHTNHTFVMTPFYGFHAFHASYEPRGVRSFVRSFAGGGSAYWRELCMGLRSTTLCLVNPPLTLLTSAYGASLVGGATKPKQKSG
jgi:hypothetical protein